MKNSIYILSFLLFFTVMRFNVNAQSGTNDPTFNPTDVGFGFGDGATNIINTSAIQSDGKIIIGGTFTIFNRTSRSCIARLKANGSLDPTFIVETGANSSVNAIAIQSDNKIIIGGTFTSYNGILRNSIARLNTDGSLDASFNVGSGANSGIYAIAVQSDGKIIIGGTFTSYNGASKNNVTRLNTDGSIDATFNIGTGTNSGVTSITLQSDEKIIIGGDFTAYNGTIKNSIARLNTDGSIDVSFNTGTGANGPIYTIALQSDGKIIIGGAFDTYNEVAITCITRLNTDGSLDATFNVGSGASDIVYTTAVQSDGKILIGGNFTLFNDTAISCIARLNVNGSLDGTFNIGTGTNAFVYTASVQSDGKIIIGGNFTSFNGTARGYIAGLNTDGSLDITFNAVTGANGIINETVIQSDGKIIIGGDFTLCNGTLINRIARLNSDGFIDSTFDVGIGANAIVNTIAVRNDGKITLGGNFTSFNGTIINRIVRLNSDGSMDNTFNIGNGANNTINTIALQNDGKIIAGGIFTSFNGTTINRIVRLNSDGSIDNTFNIGNGANNTINTITLQTDGKIIIGGNFTSYNGTIINRIARLNTDGSLDALFNVGTGANSIVFKTILQTDGKIIIGGNFTNLNGTIINRIARLNTNASIDATFNVGTGLNGIVRAIAIHKEGKIIIGGNFTTYNGTTRTRLAKLNSDGSLDATFNVNTGTNSLIVSAAIQNDAKIIIGGSFVSYNGIGRNRVARILNPSEINLKGNGVAIVDGDLTPSTADFTDFVSTTVGNPVIRTYTIENTNGASLNLTSPITITGTDASDFTITVLPAILIEAGTSTTFTVSFNPTEAGVKVASLNVFSDDLDESLYDYAITGIGTVIPNVEIAITLGTNPTCALNPVTFTASTVNGGVLPDYQWKVNGNNVGLNSNIFTSSSFANNDVVTCDLISSDPFANPTNATSNSIIMIVKNNSDSFINVTSCDSFNLNGTTYYTSGTYTQILVNAEGCDSTLTLNLTINNSTDLIINANSCYSYTLNGNTYNTSGTYIQNFINAVGCDSILTLNLTINDSTSSTLNISACETYTLNSITYNLSGAYTQTLTNAAGCDSILTLNLIINNSTSSSVDDTSCDSYSLNGNTYYVSGTYSQTLVNAAGCDSILTLNLIINNSTSSTVDATSCDTYSLNGNTYNASGTYIQNFINAAGCDSILTLNLTINNSTASTINTFACETYTLNSITYNLSDIYTQTFTNVAGCDSTLTLNLTINYSTSSTINATSCDTYSLNGNTYNESGTYTQTLTNAAGCDSILTLNLIINNSTSSSVDATSCDTYSLNGNTYNTSGTYIQSFFNAAGCDSTLTLNLTINYSTSSTINATSCDAYSLNGNTYNTSDTYIQNFINAAGCDSTLSLNLTINYSTSSSVDAISCNTYSLNGNTYNASGTYTQTLTNAADCDSILTLNLIINNSTSSTINVTSCDTYSLNGNTYNASGTYTQTLTNAADCDSILTLNLIINYSTSSTVNATSCDAYSLNGNTYNASGTYTQTLTNAAGCDSTLALNLTINYSTSSTVNATSCDTYSLNGNTYNESGTYTQTLTNAAGCDSILTLNLIIYNSTSSTVNATSCDTYSLNGNTYNESGTYTQTLTNAAGCDSILTLNLIIYNSTSSTVNVTSCDTYSLNGNTYNASGTYTQTFVNAAGCDSSVILNLIINNSNSGDTTAIACNIFTWYNVDYDISGDFTKTFINNFGCDSVVTLHLTIKPKIMVNLGMNDTLCSNNGEIAVLNAGNDGMNYLWSDSSTTQTLVVKSELMTSGIYNYSVTVTDGICSESDTITITVDICSDIVTSELSVNMNVFPNPSSSGLFNIEINENVSQALINVYDQTGRKLFDKNFNTDNYVLDLSKFSAGVYILVFNTGKLLISKQIMITGNR